VASNDRAFLQLQYDDGNAPIWTDPFDPNSDALSTQRWWQGQLVETHAFGSSAASQFLLAGSYNLGSTALRDSAKAHAAFPTTLYYATGTFSNLGQANSWDSIPVGGATTRYQVSEDFVTTHRNHKLGFGGTFERIYGSSQLYTFSAAGILVPQTLDAFFQGGVDPATPGTDDTVLTQSFASQTSQRISFYNLALYGQDEWHARSNLTLTFALRAEHQSNPVCKSRCFARMRGSFASVSHDPDQPYNQAILINQRQAFENTDNILWSPRFSFAWQPMGVSHNTVLRGGIGVFYDPLPGTLATTLASNPPLFNTFTAVGEA
jgi:TonB dependent receptor